jgi:hypothetical protein
MPTGVGRGNARVLAGVRAIALVVATVLMVALVSSFDEGCSNRPSPKPNPCADASYDICTDGGILECNLGGDTPPFSACPLATPYCVTYGDAGDLVQCATTPEPSPRCPNNFLNTSCVEGGLQSCSGGYVVAVDPCPAPGCVTPSMCAPGTPADPACRGRVAFYCSDAGVLVDCYGGYAYPTGFNCAVRTAGADAAADAEPTEDGDAEADSAVPADAGDGGDAADAGEGGEGGDGEAAASDAEGVRDAGDAGDALDAGDSAVDASG